MNEADFPLYQLLLENKIPGYERAKADFEAACAGNPQSRYSFALGIQTLSELSMYIPGATSEVVRKTLESCLKVFEDLARQTKDTELAKNSQIMVDFCARKIERK